MYNAYVTKIKNVKKHSNADRLNVGECFGNQVIISLETKEGDIGVYFPTDGQLGVKYCEVNNLVRKKDEDGKNIGGYLDPKKRNVRTMKLRGEVSDGLFMPLSSLASFTDIESLKDGETINTIGGIEICKKYIPEIKERTQKNIQDKKNKTPNKIQYPTFAEHRDTGQYAYNKHAFSNGDICYITLKMHGTSGRTSHALKKEKTYKKGISYLISKIFNNLPYKLKENWEYVTGTRRVVLKNFEGGFYGSNEFRQNHHNSFVGKLQKGETVYYEIVGYQDNDKPIMGTVSNKKTNDKEFIKKYGETTTYSYGCEIGKSDIYIYRMSMTNEDGVEIDYPWDMVKLRAEQMGMKCTPELDRFIYTTEEDLEKRVKKHEDGVDPIGLTHIREGVIIRIEGTEKFKAFKQKNTHFKILEGIIKDSGVLDLEEEESIK